MKKWFKKKISLTGAILIGVIVFTFLFMFDLLRIKTYICSLIIWCCYCGILAIRENKND